LILVAGPIGSGKTTTLYACLRQLARPSRSIITIEDPIEYRLDGAAQVEVRRNLGLSFARGLRAVLRQDPDVIMVGEIRDRDTAEMAVQAALTGHLVLSTLHTNDAPSAVTRLLDLGVPGYLINSTLLGVMAQRLIRTLCPHCRKPSDPPDDEAWTAVTAPWRADKPQQVMGPGGCLECRMTGYYGRMGLYEVMGMTPAIRRILNQDPDDHRIREQAYKDGMKPLRVSGAMKVAAGQTTIDEVMKVAPLA
jgi:general secretion pathway protein E